MENENVIVEGRCKGGACGFQLKGEVLGCTENGGSCMLVNILEAEESAFHDIHLASATQSINEILANIPEDPDGRKISFINTNMGTLLAWVDHSDIILEDAVTEDDDDATIAAALKLKNVTCADAAN